MTETSKSAGFAQRFFYWWADHPFAQITVFVALTTLTMIGFFQPTLVTDWFPKIVWEDDDSVSPRRSPAESRQRDTVITTGRQAPENVQPFQVGGGECIGPEASRCLRDNRPPPMKTAITTRASAAPP